MKNDTLPMPAKAPILKRRIGYLEIDRINEEEQVRSEKRNKMEVDTGATAGP
jgi:hypothetical protein